MTYREVSEPQSQVIEINTEDKAFFAVVLKGLTPTPQLAQMNRVTNDFDKKSGKGFFDAR